ncbi:MAG: hypothetical protein AB1704_19920 [Pseudomonadota bacterium]
MSFEVYDNWGDVPELKVAGILWKKLPRGTSGDLYSAEVSGQTWRIRMNDFPDEPMYTLIVDGAEKIHFNDWPSEWLKPKA